MASYLVCEGAFTPASVGGDSINNVLACPSGWVVKPEPDALQVLLESIFSTPPEVQIQAAFMAGFALPLFAYLTAWAFQTVINFSKSG